MVPYVVTLFLLVVSLESTSPSSIRRERAIGNQYVIQAPVNTTKGGIDHAYWFRRLFEVELSPREVECARNATVLHAATGRCAWLFEQGPCALREWLVLGAEGQGPGRGPELRAVCRPRPCAPGYGFLAQQRRCAREEDLCADDSQKVFRYSLQGEGHCHCKGFRTLGSDGRCHLLYHQGPCPPEQMLAPLYDSSLNSHRGACVRNPCREGQLRVERREGSLAACRPLGDLDCTALSLSLLTSDTGAYVPLCDDPERNAIIIHSRPPRDSCKLRDNQGKCVPAIVHTPQPFDWGLEDEEETDHDKIAFPSDAYRRYLSWYALGVGLAMRWGIPRMTGLM